MKKFIKCILAPAMLAVMSVSANAALITLQKVSISGISIARSNTNTELKDLWNNIGTNAPAQALSSFTNVDTGNNTLAKLTVVFDMLSDVTSINVQAGLDAGFGAEVFFNGTTVFNSANNIWWANNWNNAAVINLNNLVLNYGVNTLEFYWAENSNSGNQSIRFSEFVSGNLSASNLALTTTNMANVQVPAPGSFGVMALALGLMGVALRKRSRA